MASISFVFPLTILALTLHFSLLSFAQHKDGVGARPVIHFTNVVRHKGLPHVSIRIKAGINKHKKVTIALNPGEKYQLKTDDEAVYYASAQFGFKFTSFHAYDPTRDKGHADIYWRADNGGFDMSYDKKNWKPGAAWAIE